MKSPFKDPMDRGFDFPFISSSANKGKWSCQLFTLLKHYWDILKSIFIGSFDFWAFELSYSGLLDMLPYG
jgi:hypothetical protein